MVVAATSESFSFFTSKGSFSRVRWTPRQNSDVLSFVTGTCDTATPQLTLWNSERSTGTHVAAPLSEWIAEPVRSVPHRGQVLDLAFVGAGESATTAARGFVLVSASSNGEVAVHRVESDGGGTGNIKCVGRQRLHGFKEFVRKGTERVGDTETGKREEREDMEAACVGVAVQPNSSDPEIASTTGNQNGSTKVWDLRGRPEPEIKVFDTHTADVWEVMFHPLGAGMVLSCSEDSTASVVQWSDAINADQRVFEHNKFKRFDSPRNRLPINSIDCHPENGLAVVVGDTSAVFLTELEI
ncbi:hypothetical protein HK101_008216 [Irineochytrium annulatum]|nr:hypothetical protein HK101_008216 [Irineochytrium annulatum]